MKKIVTALSVRFAPDLRALALMRIGIGALILTDLLIRSGDLTAHYTDEGVLPLAELFRNAWDSSNFSFHALSGNLFFQAVMFLFAAVFAFFLLVGFKTRFSTFVSWVMMLSLHNRNPLILQAGDEMFRMILFWGIFLPWGAVWSLDNPRWRVENNSTGLSFIAYGFQVFCLYFFGALLKTSPEWTMDGTAIYYALSLDQMVMPLGRVLYNYPEMMKWLTHFVYFGELLVPLLLLVPWKVPVMRGIVVGFIFLLHTSISLTLFVGLFFLIGMVTSLGLLPSVIMDKAEQGLRVFWGRTGKLKEWLYKIRENIIFEFNIHLNKRLKKILVLSVLSVSFLYVMIYNWTTTDYRLFRFPLAVRQSAQVFGLNQCWGMFAPGVFKDDGWYILEATDADGKIFDLNRNGDKVTYVKPASVVSMFRNDRWRKYSENLLFISNSYMRPHYARYLFNKWNKDHPERKIMNLKIVYMKEFTPPVNTPAKVTREVIWEYF